MDSSLDLLGLEEVIGTIILIVVLGGILLTVLSLVWAIRAWMAQTAALQTRKDVAEIKRQLELMSRPPATPAAPVQPAAPVKNQRIDDGPKIADSSVSNSANSDK